MKMNKIFILITTFFMTHFVGAETVRENLASDYNFTLKKFEDQTKQTIGFLENSHDQVKEFLKNYNIQVTEILDDNIDLNDRLMKEGKTFSTPYGENLFSRTPLNLHEALEEFELFAKNSNAHHFYLAMERWYALSDIEREFFIKGMSPANVRWLAGSKFNSTVLIKYNTVGRNIPKIYYFVHEIKKAADRMRMGLNNNVDVNVPKITIKKIGDWSSTGGILRVIFEIKVQSAEGLKSKFSSSKEFDGLLSVKYTLDISSTIPLDTVERDAYAKGLNYSFHYTKHTPLEEVNRSSLNLIRPSSNSMHRNDTLSTIEAEGDENTQPGSHNASFE
jgi:hypothetical protein